MTTPATQYTLVEAIGACLAVCQRTLAEVRALARIPGPAGPAGPPGRNAADLKLLQEYAEQCIGVALKTASVTSRDGGRTMLWSVGGVVHEVKTAIVLDAGVWKENTTYNRGDGVTLGGSFFIAQADTAAKPGASDDWRLAVKRGADGRDWRPDEKRAHVPVKFK